MGAKLWNGVVLAAAASMWLASGTQREKPVLSAAQSARVRTLEAQVAAAPADAHAATQLAQAYLDARVPGLALAQIDASPTAVRRAPVVQHLYARALLDEGRAPDALAAEERVLDACNAEESACTAWLVASATRRADILRQLVELGVEDANAHPEASAVAYYNATRQARLALR